MLSLPLAVGRAIGTVATVGPGPPVSAMVATLRAVVPQIIRTILDKLSTQRHDNETCSGVDRSSRSILDTLNIVSASWASRTASISDTE